MPTPGECLPMRSPWYSLKYFCCNFLKLNPKLLSLLVMTLLFKKSIIALYYEALILPLEMIDLSVDEPGPTRVELFAFYLESFDVNFNL